MIALFSCLDHVVLKFVQRQTILPVTYPAFFGLQVPYQVRFLQQLFDIGWPRVLDSWEMLKIFAVLIICHRTK